MFIPANSPVAPVRIAILDSGVNLNHPDFKARAKSIKGTYNWLNKRRRHAVHDRKGHGSFMAGIVLNYAPDADLYITKIANRKPSDPSVITRVRGSPTTIIR